MRARRMEPGSKPHVALILLDDWSWEWWPRPDHAVARRALPNVGMSTPSMLPRMEASPAPEDAFVGPEEEVVIVQ